MNNLLKDSANNVFITTATILDKLTYKLTPNATNTLTPKNNDSLMKPLTAMLQKDFDRYNQVLDDFNLELKDTEYVLNYLKIKTKKDEENRKKMEQEAILRKRLEEEASRKKKEEEAKIAELKKQQEAKLKIEQEEAEKTKQIQAAESAKAAADRAQQEVKDQYNANTDDLVLDLDFDNFDFDATTNNPKSGDGTEMSNDFMMFDAISQSQGPSNNNNMVLDMFGNSSDSNNNNNNNNNKNSNAGQDSNKSDGLNDLNLEFLGQQPVQPQSSTSPYNSGNVNNVNSNSNNNNNNNNDNGLGLYMDLDMDMGMEMGDFASSMDMGGLSGQTAGQGAAQGAGQAGQVGAGQDVGQNDVDSMQFDDDMPPDRMDQLLAQFDELVPDNGG